MALDERQIAFITCVNDEEEYEECRYYLDRLEIPEGYHTDIISIRGATSGASGYNAGMKDSNARYKVYLHQDTFIKHTGFITDLLRVFMCDERIGLLGVIGNSNPGMGIDSITNWNTGKVIESFRQWDCGFPLEKDVFKEVCVVDGLLLATQYDLPWREDIFDNWHFYDISQSHEFMNSGYKVVVPWQKEAWCYHDSACSYKGMDGYYDYYKRFVAEYGTGGTAEKTSNALICEQGREYARKMADMECAMEELFAACSGGGREKLRELFLNGQLREWECLNEYEVIVRIDWQEEMQGSKLRFWEENMSVSCLMDKLRVLRHALKRMEYGADDMENRRILKKYSSYAIQEVCGRYVADRNMIFRRI